MHGWVDEYGDGGGDLRMPLVVRARERSEQFAQLCCFMCRVVLCCGSVNLVDHVKWFKCL